MSPAKIYFIFLAFVLIVGFSFYSSLAFRYKPAVDEVCSIVLENYFDLNATESFREACEKTKLSFPEFLSAHATVQLINDLLSYIKTSHLNLFDPEENVQIWLHESIDNGLRARNVSGFVVVSEVLPQSPGESAGFKVGDEILSIDQIAIHEASELRRRSGRIVLVRHEHTQEIAVQAKKYEEDESLQMKDLGDGFALLRVKSFLSSFFETQKLAEVLNSLMPYPNVIIDLRGNIGGSFPGMMRLLSAFSCEPELVGSLLISKKHQLPEVELKDELDVESQLAQIQSAQKLNLRSFKPLVCLRPHLWILVDHQTASVSEIFVDHLKQTKRAQVLGQLTAGEVVMAQWFSIASLGQSGGASYSLSVPIADYENFRYQKLEEAGVRPDIFLDYDLESALTGRDSWIDEILKMRHKQLRTK